MNKGESIIISEEAAKATEKLIRRE